MSTISTFQPLISSLHKTKTFKSPQKNKCCFAIKFYKNAIFTQNLEHLRITHDCKLRRIRSIEEDAQTPVTQEEVEGEVVSQVEEEVEGSSTEQSVAIQVSPSDKLLMYFQAEGTLNDSAIPKVTQALEEAEGVSDLNVHISEGIATVELTKQTTIQATGVASSLLEAIQGAGFKLQTLNLSFEDEELLVGA